MSLIHLKQPTPPPPPNVPPVKLTTQKADLRIFFLPKESKRTRGKTPPGFLVVFVPFDIIEAGFIQSFYSICSFLGSVKSEKSISIKSVGKPGSVNGDLGILIITPRLTALMTGQLPKVRTLLRNKDLIAGLRKGSQWL